MSDSENFSGTITGGIQDISALLPLLGTEQCEKHVGSALDRGYLYSSVTPISIFGSLGIVRATFNILIASLNIRRFRFLGATKLSDGGFTPNGVVAPVIALDPKHPKRFLAESRLEAMLTEEHIENVEDLTVSWGKGILWWNFLLVVFTLGMSAIGLVPYVRIVKGNFIKNLFPTGYGFPILRVAGSALCVNVAQFLIQIRVLVLLKTRLLFMTIDRLAKESHIDLESEINTKMGRKQTRSAWNPEIASEKCIWALQKYLVAGSDAENVKNHTVLKEIYEAQYKRQMDGIVSRVPRWLTPLLAFGLLLGCLSTVVGYIGCFYVIQHTEHPKGPLIWLVLEAVLSIFRILVWAINPSWDDSKGIVFELQLSPHAPLITCNKFEDDIIGDGIVSLARANRFLEEVVAYTGPFPAFVVDDVALYYIFTAKGNSESKNDEAPPPGMLYIVLSDHKEQTSRIVFKRTQHDKFSIYISSLEPVPGSTSINVRVNFSKEGRTDPKTHFLTSDHAFMEQLADHYDDINFKIQKQRLNPERKAFFGRTWAMQKPEEDDEDEVDFANSATALQPLQPAINLRYEGPLTAEDMAYLRQGLVERRWQYMCGQLEKWIDSVNTIYTGELLEDVPPNLVFAKDISVSVVQKYEANEVEFLLLEFRRIIELLVLTTATKWNEFIKTDHQGMVEAVLEGTFGDPSNVKEAPNTTAVKPHNEEIRKNRMMARLFDELETLMAQTTRIRKDNLEKRLAAVLMLVQERIHSRKYNDPVGDTILSSWGTLASEVWAEWTVEPEAQETVSVPNSPVSSPPSVATHAENESTNSEKDPDNTSPSHSRRPSIASQSDNRSVHSVSARMKALIASRRDELIAKIHERNRQAVNDVQNIKDDIERAKQLKNVEKLKERCLQRATQMFSRLEAQQAEFEDLHTNDVLVEHAHELVDYWSATSLNERLRLQNRKQRYLKVTDESIDNVGGQENMLRALKRSSEFSYIDLRFARKLSAAEITSVIASVKSVTGVIAPLRDADIYKAMHTNVRNLVAQRRDVCLYANVVSTDEYRKGEPYLLWPYAGSSRTNVYFFTQMKCDHKVTLRHCVTTRNGKVNIKLNDRLLEGSWGLSESVIYNFTNEDIFLPGDYLKATGQPNLLEIVLDEHSEGAYWLSDVFLPVEVVDKSDDADATEARKDSK